MHNNLPNLFFFVSDYNEEYIRKLDKCVAIIYRNYSISFDKKTIISIKNSCKKYGRKFFLSNNITLAINLNLDGVYLPSFNKCLNINKNGKKKNFTIIGSAHTVMEIRIKEKQGVELIFISPLFKNNKNKMLNTARFNLLASKTSKKVIALGGITSKNLNKLRAINSYGFAGMSYFKKMMKSNFENDK